MMLNRKSDKSNQLVGLSLHRSETDGHLKRSLVICGPQRRGVIDRFDPAHLAPFGMNEAAAAMNGGTIVVHDEIARLPLELLKAKAIPLTAELTGLVSFRALRGVENVHSVMFLVEWESVEAHLASRPEPAHELFRQLVLPYTTGAKPTVHFDPV